LGATPASVALGKPVPENPVVIIGKVLNPPQDLKAVRAGDKISIIVSERTTPAPEKNAFVLEKKLSQPEIDVLVKKLLEEKKRSS
jgi:hypothetical protein